MQPFSKMRPSDNRLLSKNERRLSLISRCFTILFIILQGGILDYYIVLYNGNSWIAIVLLDIFTICFIGLTHYLSNQYVLKRNSRFNDENLPPTDKRWEEVGKAGGVLPLVFANWLVFSSCLVAKICIIFKTFGPQLSGDVFWGTNLLEFVTTGTAGIFVFMVGGRYMQPTSSQKVCLEFMQHHVLIEIIDCVEFLTILFTAEHHLVMPRFVNDLILAFACVNLILPTVGLYQLSATNFNRKRPRENFHIIQTVLSTVLGNVPYLIIRVFLWTDHEFTNALFVMKNIIAIGQNLKELFHYFHQEPVEPALLMSDKRYQTLMLPLRESP